MLTFQVDQASADRVNALLSIAFAPQAARSLSRAANSAKTAMVKPMAAAIGAKQADMKRFVFTTPATPTSLVARIYPTGYAGIPLIQLGATGPEPSRGQGHGVSTRTVAYPSAFIATMPSGHRGVFLRKGTKRLPIKEVKSIPIPQLFAQFRDVGVARAAEALKTNLAADLKFALKKF